MGGFIRIAIAGAVGTALVGGALYARANAPADTTADLEPAAAVVANPLRTYQDIEDADADGTPDWEQELTGPKREDAEVSAEPFEPKTLTEQFAVNLFTSYLVQKVGSGVQQDRLVQQGLAQVTAMNTNTWYTRNDIVIVPETSIGRLRDYGNEIGTIFKKSGEGSAHLEDEIEVLLRALQSNDPSALSSLSAIQAHYAAVIAELRAVPVPVSLASYHLDIVNGLQAWHDGVAGMQLAFDDPLAALIRIKRYQDDTQGLANALDNLRRVLEGQGIFYDQTEGGALLFSLRP